MTDNPTRDLIAENARLRSVISFAAEALEEHDVSGLAYCILKGALEEPEPISDADLPKGAKIKTGDGSHPDDDAFARFKNERDYISQHNAPKSTIAAMDWAIAEIERLRTISSEHQSASTAEDVRVIQEADAMVGALWTDLFNKDLIKPDGADYFDKWRERIRALSNGGARC